MVFVAARWSMRPVTEEKGHWVKVSPEHLLCSHAAGVEQSHRDFDCPLYATL
jgi:hypothetical protein